VKALITLQISPGLPGDIDRSASQGKGDADAKRAILREAFIVDAGRHVGHSGPG
jgi:hypothetical protein